MLHSRLASFLLLLASPALAGTVLPIAHPCPVDAPWLAQGSGSAEHEGHHGQAPANESGHSCTCPGASTAGVTDTALPASATTAFSEAPVRRLTLARSAPAEWTRSFLDRLPPSTAPPIA